MILVLQFGYWVGIHFFKNEFYINTRMNKQFEMKNEMNKIIYEEISNGH